MRDFCQCKILDGAAVVNFLSTDSLKTFAEYADKVFIPFLLQQLQQACRVDCVWVPSTQHQGSYERTQRTWHVYKGVATNQNAKKME